MTREQIKQKYDGLQTKALKAAKQLSHMGDWACLFMSLCSIAEEQSDREMDIVTAYIKCLEAKYVDNEWTCLDQCAILQLLTGKKWTRRTVASLGVVADNEYTVEKWVRGKNTHFRRRYVDTVKDSKTVKYGKLDCYYIYKVEE